MESDQPHATLVNPRIFELEVKPKLVLSHEVGAGAPCSKCACPGLDLHFWRKRCKNCSCPLAEHDVVMESDHAEIVIGRLFGAREMFEGTLQTVKDSSATYATPSPARALPSQTVRSPPTAQYNVRIESAGGDRQTYKSVTEYAWVPLDDGRMADKFMQSLPQEERPIIGTEGETNRKRRLAQQLPLFDFNQDGMKMESEEEREALAKFVNGVRKNTVGVGEVVEVDRDAYLDKAARGLSVDEKGRITEPSGHVCILPTDCKECTVRLDEGDVGVQTDHGEKGDTWHPSCFRCCECNQLLADLIYFFHKGKYYCGRHFAEKQYPRCNGCDELIFAKEYTLAEGKSWHFDHFACDKCDLRLGGHRYITKDEQPHCLQCYLLHYAKTCAACERKISADEKRLNYSDLHWHADELCFKCEQCGVNLIGRKFLLKEKHLFCSAPCKATFISSH